jgi:hypothetical protein
MSLEVEADADHWTVSRLLHLELAAGQRVIARSMVINDPWRFRRRIASEIGLQSRSSETLQKGPPCDA